MKQQHQASVQDLEKRLRFLDEYKRIVDKAGEITDINDDEREEEAAEDKSPSSQFFLAK